jgi:hypothetical protein
MIFGLGKKWSTIRPMVNHQHVDDMLVVWNMFYFPYNYWEYLGMSSSQLTFTPSFFRGVGWNHQPVIVRQLDHQGIDGMHWNGSKDSWRLSTVRPVNKHNNQGQSTKIHHFQWEPMDSHINIIIIHIYIHTNILINIVMYIYIYSFLCVY